MSEIPPQEEQDERVPKMGIVSRVIGIFLYPGRVFESVRDNPTILGPMLILMIVSAAVVPIVTPMNADMVESQIRAINPEATQEQIDQAKAQSGSDANMIAGAIAAVVMVPLMMAFFAALYWGIYTVLMGKGAPYKSAMAIVTHSQLVTIAGTVAIISLSVFQNELVLSLHLGSLVPFLESDNLIFRILKSIDVFTGWWIFLLSIGFAALYRTTPRQAATVPFTLWTLWIVVKVAFFGKYLPFL